MRKGWRYGVLVVFAIGICLCLRTGAQGAAVSRPISFTRDSGRDAVEIAQSPAQQGRAFYEAGQFAEALPLLQQALETYQQQGNSLQQTVTLSNLALVYQQLGQWNEANQAIADSLKLIEGLNEPPAAKTQVLAQVLSIRGRLQLAQGQAELALASWEQVADLYTDLEDVERVAQSRLNQAQALQGLGFYRRAIGLLTDLNHSVPDQPASLLKVTVLRSLGDALQVSGDLDQARLYLEQAQQLLPTSTSPQPELSAALHLSLANLTRVEATTQLSLSNLDANTAILELGTPSTPSTLAEASLKQRRMATAQRFAQQLEAALPLYQQAADQAASPSTRIQAQLGELNTLLELQRWTEAAALITVLQPQLAAAPISQGSLHQQINFGLSWLKSLQASGSGREEINQTRVAIDELLQRVAEQAAELGDRRTQSFALGSLGEVGLAQDQAAAEQATQQALMLSQAINAADLSYRWQWQLGRLLNQKGDRAGAITAYTEAVGSLQALRNDLVAINRDVQFSFQAQVEPVYRELVDLLLAPETQIPVSQLVQAREVIEGLQIAELDNFFREACLETQFEIDRVIDREKLSAAVFYTIALPDRLEVILKLPEQSLFHYTTQVSRSKLEATVNELLAELKRPYTSQRAQILSQQIYDWLIRPVETSLNQYPIQTLVFLLDSALRNLPIAALHDGEQFLVQNYSLALAPGLQLADPKPLQERRFNVLVAGLSEARANFAPLNFVQQEIQNIQAELPSKVLFNQTFTPENLQQQFDAATFSIVHIATHGQFSSNAAETFILAWDRPIGVNELSDLLQTEEVNSPEPIELLVLSACRTAVGDQRAALGMAGVAVRAGARSTIASLWNLDDDSGAVLMDQFYQSLVQPVSKAEALRRAQLALLENPRYAAPRFWAPYVLLGNWL